MIPYELISRITYAQKISYEEYQKAIPEIFLERLSIKYNHISFHSSSTRNPNLKWFTLSLNYSSLFQPCGGLDIGVLLK